MSESGRFNSSGGEYVLIELIKAVIIGIVEGVTEWLPVSSTGHMILLDEFLRLNVSHEFREMFLVVIQLGAVLAVAVTFFRKLFPFYPGMSKQERGSVWSLWLKIILACVPAAVIGIPFEDKIDKLFFNWQTVAAALIIYGILFIVIEKTSRGKPRISDVASLSYRDAFIIGLFQLLALIPGTSRSGATIVGAMFFLGASRTVATEFTFFLSLPVMAGASLIKLLKFGFAFTGAEAAILLVGSITAFLVSIAAIRFLTGFVKKHTFIGFGWYRIALGAAVMFYFLLA